MVFDAPYIEDERDAENNIESTVALSPVLTFS